MSTPTVFSEIDALVSNGEASDIDILSAMVDAEVSPGFFGSTNDERDKDDETTGFCHPEAVGFFFPETSGFAVA